MTDDAAVNETIPGFPLRWRGYDCSEVDRFIRKVAVDRRRLDEAFARLDALIASRQDGRADEIVAKAYRHADEIRTTAEQEARRILRDAESQGEYLQCERLKTSRREIERLESVRKDIEACLETALVALTRARGSSMQGTGDVPAITPAAQPAEDTKSEARCARRSDEGFTFPRPDGVCRPLDCAFSGDRRAAHNGTLESARRTRRRLVASHTGRRACHRGAAATASVADVESDC